MEVKNLDKTPLLVVLMLILAFTVCAVPTVAEQTWEIEYLPDLTENVILNDSDQADLIQLVVFAFTIGIIMTILGFAMAMMYFKRR